MPTNSTLHSPVRQTLGRVANSLHYTLNIAEQEEDDEETHLTTQLLATLLQLPLRGRTQGLPIPRAGGGGLDAFLQPVPVRPTQEQIDANSTVGNLVSDTEHSCAICQDTLTNEQEGRKLNACGHWFHRNCIDTWLEGNVHCPVCRHDIREPASASTSETTS